MYNKHVFFSMYVYTYNKQTTVSTMRGISYLKDAMTD